jgi:hypothetical protein
MDTKDPIIIRCTENHHTKWTNNTLTHHPYKAGIRNWALGKVFIFRTLFNITTHNIAEC